MKLRAWAPHAQRGGENQVAVRTAYIDMAQGNAVDTKNGGGNQAPGTIRQRLFHGDFIQYIVDRPCGALTVRRPPTEMFEEGAAVTLFFAPEHCILLEA